MPAGLRASFHQHVGGDDDDENGAQRFLVREHIEQYVVVHDGQSEVKEDEEVKSSTCY